MNNKEIKRKIKLLQDLKKNPLSDQNTIKKLIKDLELVNTNTLTEEELHTLAN